MKMLRVSVLLVCALALVNYGAALAEFNPQQVVTDFRNLNVNNTGFDFASEPVYGGNAYRYFIARNGSALPDLSAYTGIALLANGFRSYCIDVQIQHTAQQGTAVLSYNAANGTTSNRSGKVVNLAIAWLHTQYVRGNLAGYDESVWYDGDSMDLFYEALRVLMSGTTQEKYSYLANANNHNPFITQMLNAGAMYGYTADDWLTAYDMRDRYDIIGDYAVFVMTITGTDGRAYQDFLYLAPANYGNGGGVPEPATLLLWTLGGFGLAGTSWTRKRRMHKLA